MTYAYTLLIAPYLSPLSFPPIFFPYLPLSCPPAALLRQTNPLWIAFFFVTDTNPFDQRLRDIVAQYQDPRLVFTPIPNKHKIQVSYDIRHTTYEIRHTTCDYVIM
jgi:hypothetical protein